MSNLHIYVAGNQPATNYYHDFTGERMLFKNSPHCLLWAGCCHRLRRAGNCLVQCYYDMHYYRCAPGGGCKSEREIEAKRRREFRHRSAAAKKGWLKRT